MPSGRAAPELEHHIRQPDSPVLFSQHIDPGYGADITRNTAVRPKATGQRAAALVGLVMLNDETGLRTINTF